MTKPPELPTHVFKDLTLDKLWINNPRMKINWVQQIINYPMKLIKFRIRAQGVPGWKSLWWPSSRSISILIRMISREILIVMLALPIRSSKIRPRGSRGSKCQRFQILKIKRRLWAQLIGFRKKFNIIQICTPRTSLCMKVFNQIYHYSWDKT